MYPTLTSNGGSFSRQAPTIPYFASSKTFMTPSTIGIAALKTATTTISSVSFILIPLATPNGVSTLTSLISILDANSYPIKVPISTNPDLKCIPSTLTSLILVNRSCKTIFLSIFNIQLHLLKL